MEENKPAVDIVEPEELPVEAELAVKFDRMTVSVPISDQARAVLAMLMDLGAEPESFAVRRLDPEHPEW